MGSVVILSSTWVLPSGKEDENIPFLGPEINIKELYLGIWLRWLHIYTYTSTHCFESQLDEANQGILKAFHKARGGNFKELWKFQGLKTTSMFVISPKVINNN